MEVNARIAAARAEAVKTILVNKYKISASRITAEGQGVGAVSYTHLDVYKRQSPCCSMVLSKSANGRYLGRSTEDVP